MRIKIFSWIGILWGTFIVVTAGPRILAGRAGEGASAAGQFFALGVGGLMLFAGIRTLRNAPAKASPAGLHDMATRYTAAWCGQRAAGVASFFAEHGSLTINGGAPALGRAAIAAAAQGFMTAFPDMIVTMDALDGDEINATYHWTLTGTNTGPGGTGRPVRITGYEEWFIGPDGLIVDSQGHFDEEEYQRQLAG
jgi:hypothetical protein